MSFLESNMLLDGLYVEPTTNGTASRTTCILPWLATSTAIIYRQTEL